MMRNGQARHTTLRFQRTLSMLLLTALCATGIIAEIPTISTVKAQPIATSILYAQKPCTPVYASPDTHSTLYTQLLPGTDVTAKAQLTRGTTKWTQVAFWAGMDGYIPADQLAATFPANVGDNGCDYPGLPSADSNPLRTAHGPFSINGRATITIPTSIYTSPDKRSMPVSSVASGATVTFSHWATDARGNPWYQVSGAQGSGWIWGGNLRIEMPNPATHTVDGQPVWAPIAGKGMYGTNYLVHHSDVNALVQAAKKAGITHIYTEVAITRFGFYAQDSLNRLLPVAHKAGIAVIAWIYTNLDNIGDDARMTQLVANYRTPTGDRADGMLMDIEEVTDSASVYMYGQLSRAMLGPDGLFVASVFHPFARPGYPYAAIAASFNVIAPMNYWHSRRNRMYSDEMVERFVSVSIQTIRAAMSIDGGTPLPVEETGQTYNMFTPASTGRTNAPTAAEVTADLRTAHEIGCIGVSLYEWQTTTQEEWAAISAYAWE